MNIQIYYGNKTLKLTQNVETTSGKVLNDVSEVETFWESEDNEATLFNASVKDAFKALKKKYKYIEAAGGLVKNSKGEYLLMYRRGKWDLPKGKAEKGETIDQTALREVEEETAVKGLSIEKELPSTYHMYTEKGKTILKRTYWYEMTTNSTETLVAQTAEGIEEVEWLSANHFDKVYQNTFPSIVDVLKHVQ